MQQAIDLLITASRLLRSRLYTNMAHLWLSTLALAILGFAFWGVVARLYPPEAVGLGSTVVTSAFVLAEVSQLGLGYVLIRFIPQSGLEAPILLSRSLVTVAVASLLSGLIFLGTVPLWSQDLQDLLWKDAGHVGVFLAFVIFVTLADQLRFAFIAYRRGIGVLALIMSTGLLRLLVASLLAGLGSAFGIVIGHGVAVLLSILIVMLFFLPGSTGKLRLPLALDVWRLAPLAPFSLSNLASHVLTVLAWQLLPLLVMALAGAATAGFFYIAWAVAGIMLIMMEQLALSLLAEGSNHSREVRAQACGALVIGVALGTLFAVAVYFLGDLVLLLFGREYVEQSNGVLRVLAAATPLAAVTHVYLSIERVCQRLVPLMAVSAAVALVMLGAIMVLVPRMGIVGAGYGVVAGYGVGTVLSLLLLYPMMKGSHHLVGRGQSTTR
jgi:O-antigen/teichoic acid export membrane protein